MRANRCEKTFYRLLDDIIIIACESVRYAYARIARFDSVKVQVAPILYMEGTCWVRLKSTTTLSKIFKHSGASISFSCIG